MIKITLDESVLHFTTNKWAIPKEAHATLDAVVQKLKDVPLQVNISGHTDSRGTARWNAVLSKHRAESVKKYLLDHGIGAGRIVSVIGDGPSSPVADNKTDAGRSKNRRVEISSVAPVEVPAK
jgi:outer membrane protein OmpA-like peptidoglycan-associated protein